MIRENNELVKGAGADVESIRSGESRVLVKADPTLTYKDVIPVILALHEMGTPNIDLGTHEKKE